MSDHEKDSAFHIFASDLTVNVSGCRRGTGAAGAAYYH